MKLLNKTILTLPIILFCLLAGFAVCSGTVRAAELCEFEVTGGTTNFDANKGVLTVTSGSVTIKNIKENAPTTQRIVVEGKAEVTLEGVNIDASGKDGSAFSITPGKAVTLILEKGSSNVLMSSGDYAGLHVPETASLTIRGPGSLEAKCVSETGYANGAGIGGGGGSGRDNGGSGGTVTIEGGTVTAYCTVTSSGNATGAGIGGGGSEQGTGGNGGTVTIKGGTVRASSKTDTGFAIGAGIGGGGSYNIGGGGADVIIDGGNVIAEGGEGAENIGHGYKGTGSGTLKNNDGKALSLVTLTPGTNLTESQFLTDLWVGDYKGDDTPDAANKIYGIKDMKTISIGKIGKLCLYLPADLNADDFVLMGLKNNEDEKNIYTGKIEQVPESTDRKGDLYKGVNLSCFPSGQHLFIGENQFAISPDGASGTVGYSGDYSLKGGSAGDPIQNTVTVQKGYGNNGKDRTITLDGLNIDVSNDSNACAFAIEAGAQISLRLENVDKGTNSLTSSANCAGLNVPEGASLEVITENGLLNAVCKAANGDATGAGIGGNNGKNGGKVTIKGGDTPSTPPYRGGVNAICQAENGNASGAGIGGGAGGAGGEITIEGSTIIASCEAPKGTASGAGIGGGQNGIGGTVVIDGGNVKAVGGSDAENIGYGSGATESGSLKNSDGKPVYLNIFFLNLPSATDYTYIKTLSIGDGKSYGIYDVRPLDITTDNTGKFYFYLPPTTEKKEIYLEYNLRGATLEIYTRSYTRKASHMKEEDMVWLLKDTYYEVTIPAEISFDNLSYKKSKDSDKYSLKSFGITASKFTELVHGRSLSVRVSSPDQKFVLTRAKSERKLEYEVFEGKDLTDFTQPLKQNEAAVQGFNTKEGDATKYATLRLDQSKLRYSGDYTGTLTFAISIDDAIE